MKNVLKRVIGDAMLAVLVAALLIFGLVRIKAAQGLVDQVSPAGMEGTCIDSEAGDLLLALDGIGTRFAVIGDYGDYTRNEQVVANLVKSWNPDFIITTGDNNYPDGESGTIDYNVGQFYGKFIYPYHGEYASDDQSTVNRFFPTLGNHDWHTERAQPYLDYFALPGNERYYDFTWGPVHLFALDSDGHEPDGVSQDSIQALWLRDRLASSTAVWNIVFMHQPPYSSGTHGSSGTLQWPFREWGATAVIAGHDHTYERILQDGFPYFVNGLGGKSRYLFMQGVPGSQVRYRADYGAMLVEANDTRIVFRFYTQSGCLIDEYGISAAPAE
jgi:tartrate-resistant acid phosphatase type 5